MATYTSKKLIPGQTPIGQNRDGSYIYEEVMSKATTAPKATTPIYTPPTAIAKIPTDGKTNFMPLVTPENARKPNAPVKDTLNFSKRIKNDDARVIQLREHFDYLKQNNELFLNDKQTDYIKRFKEKYPDYASVPDTILYGKVLLTDPKVQEKYGNIGEKTFMQRLRETPMNVVESLAGGVDTGIERYQTSRELMGNDSSNLGYENLKTALAGGGALLTGIVDAAFGVVGDTLNVVGKPTDYNTSYTEGLLQDVSKLGISALDKAKTGIDKAFGNGTTDTIIKGTEEFLNENPEAKGWLLTSEGLSNLIGLGLFGGGKKVTEQSVKEILKKVNEEILQKSMTGVGKFGGKITTETFEAGMNQGITGGLRTGGTTLNEYLKQLPPEKPAGKPTITRAIPEKTVANFLNLTPTERGNVEKILGGKTAEQYILEKNLGGISKGELTDIFQKQATDSYNGIKEQLKTITERIESKGAKTAIDDMLETFDSLSSLEKDVYKRDIEYLKTLAEQSDYSLSELHALRQAFDKVNTGMYTAKGSVRSGTRAGAEVEVRNMLSNDIQDNAIKQGVDVKKMNQDLRVALTLKDGLLRSLSQESKNNLVGLQDIGIMGIFSGGEPLTAISLGVGKKFLEGKMPGMAQKLYNLNKTPYENTAVKRGNTIVTNNGSRLFGLSDNMGGGSADNLGLATPKSVTPVVSGPGKSLAVSMENKTIDVKKALDQFEKLTPEEKAKALQGSPRLAELVKVTTEIKDIQEFKGDFGYTPPEIIDSLGDNYLNYSPEAKEIIRKGLDKEDLATLQKMNREKAGLPEPVVEEKVATAKENKEFPKKVTDLEEEIGMLDDNKGNRSSFVQKYDGADEYGTAGDAYDAVKDMDRFEFEDYASLWKDKDGGGMVPKNETASKIIDDIDGFADKLGISSDDAIILIRDGTGGSRYKENLANFKARYGVAPFQAKKKLAQFKKAWEAGKNPSIDDFLYKSEKTVDFSKPSKEEMAIENSKTPFDDDPVSPLAKKEPTTTETIEEVVTPVKDTTEVTETPKVGPVKKTYEEYKADQVKKYQKEMNTKIEASKKRVEAFEKDTNSPGSRAKWLEDDIKAEKSFFDTMTSDKWLTKQYEKYSKTRDAQIKEADFKKTIADRKAKTPQEGKTGSELFKKNTDIDVNDTIKLVYKGTSDRTLGKMNDYTIYKDGTNVGTTDIIDRGDHYTIGNIGLKDYAQRKGIGSDIHKFVITQFDKPFKTDPALSDKMLGMLEKLKNEGYLTSKETPGKYGTKKAYESAKPKSLPLSQKSEVKYSEPDNLAQEAKKYKSADDFIKAQEGSMYFHGTNVDFKKPDVSKVGTGEGSIMAGKGFNLTSLSSDAKNYAYQVSQKKGGKEVILGTKIDKNKMNLFDADKMDKDVKMQSEIIDFILKKQNEFKGLTKDKIIGKLDDKWTGDFMGLIEEEYGFAKYVDDFIKSKGFDGVITKERTSQKWGKIRPENITIFNPKDIEMVNLIDIYNKANKK